MDPLLLALLVVAILVLAWECSRRPAPAGFCTGPDNIGLYDHPYYYPTYVARAATAWDADDRCAANCGAGGCAVWCR